MACFYIQIKDLTLYSHSFFVTGLVIAKSEKKILTSRQNGSINGVITFTVRDTKDHFINCIVWGTEYFIENCDRAYKIGHMITVYQPKVTQKNSNSAYNPRTSSPFELTLNEGKSFIHRATEHFDALFGLKNLAIKSTSLALKLNDLYLTPDESTLNVDLVVLVRSIEPGRQVQTKSGLKSIRRVYLMDTTMESISMTIWNTDYHSIMDQWIPLQTILHLVDVQARFSDFERSTVLMMTSKTIVIENPVHSSRCNELMDYIHNLSETKINALKINQTGTTIDPAAITEVLTVKRILDQKERDPSKEIAGIVIGVITKFDINSGIIKCCVHCKRLIPRNRSACENDVCFKTEINGQRTVDRFNIAVSFADHSGSLNGRINDIYGEKILGHTAQAFKMLTESKIDAIFSRFILERFAIKLVVKPKTAKDYFVNILSIETISSNNMAASLKL